MPDTSEVQEQQVTVTNIKVFTTEPTTTWGTSGGGSGEGGGLTSDQIQMILDTYAKQTDLDALINTVNSREKDLFWRMMP